MIVGDVPMGDARADVCATHIRSLMLVNDVSLRNLIPAELGQGLRLLPVQAVVRVLAGRRDARRARRSPGTEPSCTAAPRRAQRPSVRPGERRRRHDLRFPRSDRPRGQDAAARRRHDHRLRHGVEQGRRRRSRPAGREGGLGYSCLAELRTVETIASGAPKTPFLKFGDTVRIEMQDAAGQSIFGAIEQTLERD